MPRFNGTGPQGQGPMTGRGIGPCADNRPGAGQGAGRGYGQDRGYGMGRGRGQGWFSRWCPWSRSPVEPDYPDEDQTKK
ncbi:DUF5320 domain-containing protein [Patescibacteria group bacterium]|nr:DUF5320 domain-containing protein [Patescibacteria group bacterium]MBU1922308.1 DUF5320 domain-containing protein [Patescibacteria group bacterium]